MTEDKDIIIVRKALAERLAVRISGLKRLEMDNEDCGFNSGLEAATKVVYDYLTGEKEKNKC